jgi:hypothetical protein
MDEGEDEDDDEADDVVEKEHYFSKYDLIKDCVQIR